MNQTPSRLATVAATVGPALNRIVFCGIESYDHVLPDARTQVRGATVRRGPILALSTVVLDRLGTELAGAGLQRTRRSSGDETWRSAGGDCITVLAASAEIGDATDAMVREYASLLTKTIGVAPGIEVRVSAPAILPALWWMRRTTGARRIVDSIAVEDMIELVARHAPLADEIQSLPSELRVVQASVAQSFLDDDACSWIVGRALIDARGTPGVVDDMLSRFRRIAAMAATSNH